VSDGNVVVSNQQGVGQTFTVGILGRLIGVEVALLLDTALPSDRVTLQVYPLGVERFGVAGFAPGCVLDSAREMWRKIRRAAGEEAP